MKAVVYIDDEPMLCRVFRRILEMSGARVETFTVPEDAIAYIREHGASVVICDFRMPTLTGLEVLERLPEDIPFYLASGDLGVSLSRDRPRVTGVLTKPYRPEALIEAIRRHVPEIHAGDQ